MRTSVTIRDVARLAEVHPGTVSRALNEQTRALVNPKTAERVIEAALQLGYRPNPIARGLKTNRSLTIGVLIPDLTNPLFPPIMRGIEDRLGEAGYTLLTVNTDNDPDRERTQMEALRARQVDGFIAATARLDGELLAELAADGTPRGAGQPQPRGRVAAGRHGRRPARDRPRGRAHRLARPRADRARRRAPERLHRSPPPPRLHRVDGRRGQGRARRADRLLGRLHRARGDARVRAAAHPRAADHRDRRRQ